MKNKKNKKEFLLNIILLIFVLLICLILLEIVLRIFWEKPGYGYSSGLFIPDEKKGYEYKPYFNGTFQGTLYKDIEININSKGLRDYEYEYAKQPNVFRILFLGDSATVGAGVNLENTFAKKLESNLRNKSYNVEVINAAVNSYEFDQEYIFYLDEGYKYSPDILIIGVALNDAGEVDIKKVKENYFGKGILSNEVIQEFLKSHCYFCNFFRFNWIVIKNRLSGEGKDFNDQYFLHVYNLWNGEISDHAARELPGSSIPL